LREALAALNTNPEDLNAAADFLLIPAAGQAGGGAAGYNRLSGLHKEAANSAGLPDELSVCVASAGGYPFLS